MKTNLYCLTTLMALFYMTSCTKVQMAEEQEENLNARSIPVTKSSCEALSFNTQSLSDPDYHYSNFTKTVDPVTGKISSIEVGIYSGGSISEWVNFHLR